MTLMVDAVMALVVLEAVVLLVIGRATILPNIAAGFMLLLAMRLALANAGLPWVGVSLLLAGLTHALDLNRRLTSLTPVGRGQG